MNSFHLKLIAVITMVIDHIAAVLIPQHTVAYFVMRCIGRISFPIFCFLLVEGCYHTKNVKKYAMRLFLFALISEIPFDFAVYGTPFYAKHQNIFFTLAIGLVVIASMKFVEIKFGQNILAINCLDAVIVMVGCIISNAVLADYSMFGILLIVCFYLFRGNKILNFFGLLAITGYVSGNLIQMFGALSWVFLVGYNGERGKGSKYLFYVFYPLHLLILGGIKFLI